MKKYDHSKIEKKWPVQFKKAVSGKQNVKTYNHDKIERKWQKHWSSKKIYKTKEGGKKPKCYVLDMFPYLSGEGLHVGHPRGYIATDVYSRFKRMNGFNVLHPMGFDSFGLPAENYAIKNKIHPEVAVKNNVKRFKKQLGLIGFDYDWDRELITSDPDFYKWTQWIFLKMFEKGLAYESFEPINFCPSCLTGLANEDVEDGKCERCGTLVVKKPMRQWMLKITDYAERLLRDLDELKNWPEHIKEAQRNWIGKSLGTTVKFEIRNTKSETNSKLENINSKHFIEVFTTRIDTIFGCTYLVVAPEHPIIENWKLEIGNYDEVAKYIEETKNKSDLQRTDLAKEKTGVELKDVKAINPFNGEELPIFVADYVLASYGTGAVMAVPAHDERDWEFAKKYNLPIKEVIVPCLENKKFPMKDGAPLVPREHVDCILRNPKNDEYAALKWNEKYGWTTLIGGGVEEGEDIIETGAREIREETGYKNIKFIKVIGRSFGGGFAAHKGENRLSDITCLLFELVDDSKEEIDKKEKEKHQVVWVKKGKMSDFLNVESSNYLWSLYLNGFRCFTGEGRLINQGQFESMDSVTAREKMTRWLEDKKLGGRKINYKLKDWVFSRQRYWGEPIPLIHCENCGVVTVPEKDLPVKLPKVKFYEPTDTGESPLAKMEKWVNVKCPKCGGKGKRETNTMPQWAGSSWYYLRYIDPKNKKLPVDKKKESYWSPVDMYVGGTEHATRHLIYARFWHKFLYDIGIVNYKEPFASLKNQGLIMGNDGRKMSKRWGNIVNPDDVVAQFGADTLRVYEMFMGPFDQPISWSTDNMVGSRRFLEKVYSLSLKIKNKKSKIKITDKNSSLKKDSTQSEKLERLIHQTIKKVSEDVENFRFNTAISALMILMNEMEKQSSPETEDYELMLKLLSPFAPHITEDLWNNLGNKKSIHLEDWPKYDESKIQSDEIIIVVQVNGKVRGSFKTLKGQKQEEIENIALSLSPIKKWIGENQIKKIFFVKDKVVSIII